jgi:hypothetical protein
VINPGAGSESDFTENELTMDNWAHRLGNLRLPVLQNRHSQTPNQPAESVIPKPLDVYEVLQPLEEHAAMPWEELLSGGPEAPKLSFARTEDEFLDSESSTGLMIHRTWDIDSYIARVTSFDAYRFGFNLFYIPSFLSREKRTQHVTLDDGCKVYECKNLCLGAGVLAEGTFRTHVVFRHMSTAQTGTGLTDEEQKFWIDDIVLPVLRKTFDDDVVQHHPQSFIAAKCKARALQEKHPSGSQHPMTFRATIPENGLAEFSANLEEHIREGVRRQPERYSPYKDPLFVIAGHNLKLKIKSATVDGLQRKFVDFLETCFRFRPEYFPDKDCWIDMGLEDTPDHNSCGERGTLIEVDQMTKVW